MGRQNWSLKALTANAKENVLLMFLALGFKMDLFYNYETSNNVVGNVITSSFTKIQKHSSSIIYTFLLRSEDN